MAMVLVYELSSAPSYRSLSVASMARAKKKQKTTAAGVGAGASSSASASSGAAAAAAASAAAAAAAAAFWGGRLVLCGPPWPGLRMMNLTTKWTWWYDCLIITS